MNNTDNTQDSGDLGGGTTLGGYSYYGIGISIAVLVVFVVITYFSYKCKAQSEGLSASARRRLRLRSSSADEDLGSIHIVIQRGGLDAAVISTFPLYTYAQLKPHKGAAATASGCAVCLGDYKDSEAVRLLPECGHVFHRSCIDPWLMIHPTCPICRNSPMKAPPPPPPPPPPRTPPPPPPLAEAQPTPVANQ